MKNNQIMYQYSLWLEKYCQSNPPKNALKAAQSILESLPQIEDISDLIDLLERYIPKEPSDFQKEENPVYQPINFYCQLMNWRQEIHERVTQFEYATTTLRTISTTSKTEALVKLLTEILEAPEAILRSDLKSLLQLIRDPNFPKVLKYINATPESPKPDNPRPGSFAAMLAINDTHETCLSLLNNIASAYPSQNQNPLWEKSNSLLQTSLKLYSECIFTEIDLKEIEEPAPKKSNRWCTLL